MVFLDGEWVQIDWGDEDWDQALNRLGLIRYGYWPCWIDDGLYRELIEFMEEKAEGYGFADSKKIHSAHAFCADIRDYLQNAKDQKMNEDLGQDNVGV